MLTAYGEGYLLVGVKLKVKVKTPTVNRRRRSKSPSVWLTKSYPTYPTPDLSRSCVPTSRKSTWMLSSGKGDTDS